jgi:hypothetical protein
LITYFASEFAFRHQQNLIAFFVRFGFVTGRIPGASVIIAV